MIVSISFRAQGGEPAEAVPLLQEIASMVKSKVEEAGHQAGTVGVIIECVRCGKPMNLVGKNFICGQCACDEALDRRFQAVKEAASAAGMPGPVQPAETVF